jgi:ATP-GRASP peptide maturase of grasp-with-spasm system
MKKVLIISEVDDLSTDDVIAWLYHKGIPSYRISDSHPVQFHQCVLSNNLPITQSFKIDNEVINISDFQGIWYRRGQLLIKTIYNNPELFNRFRTIEDSKLTEFYDSSAAGVSQINHYKDNFINKLHALNEARKLGINIPETHIVCRRSDIPQGDYSKYITKAIAENGRTFYYKGYTISHSCSVKLLSDIEVIPEEFAPSLIQQCINKRFEIRSFYISGQFKSMAIFSQENQRTKVDFRNYDHARPNRCVPFNLPKHIEDSLNQLMQNLNLSCGSIDLIFTPKGDYYFLEVNPIGQFQWLSKNCNYYIERLIANKLHE